MAHFVTCNNKSDLPNSLKVTGNYAIQYTNTHTHTHTHNHFTALLDLVRDYLGEPVSER